MEYLGGLRGSGLLMCAGAPISRTEYDLDGYLSKAGQVTGCGEIRLRASALRGVFGREELQLRTDEGQLLRLHFSEKRLSPDVGAAHVDLVGDLPAAADWRRSSERRPPRPPRSGSLPWALPGADHGDRRFQA